MSVSRGASSRRANRFSFSDYRFAAFVRGRMIEVLTHFDANGNQDFEEEEIKAALVEILQENPNELRYVVQNVFRYDRDNDGKVTLREFVDFSVEQHFGEMAVQRLHRQKLYSQGQRRVMNLPEFIQTLEYSLSPIKVSGPQEIYEVLFREIDLDGDGFISYEDFFIFLREYFGTQSPIYDNDTMPVPPQPPAPTPAPSDPGFSVDNRATERFAKLVYSQLKVAVMQLDHQRSLSLAASQVVRFLEEVLQMNEGERDYVSALIMKGQQRVGYEPFLQFIVPFYFQQYFIGAVGLEGGPIDLQGFVGLTTKAASMIVAVPPSEKTLMSIFYLAAGSSSAHMQLGQYVDLMGTIFENFSFDKRGLARGH